MPQCCVRNCKNAYRKTRNGKLPIRYHRIPMTDPDITREWVRRSGNLSMKVKSARYCSDHFNPETDYEIKPNLLPGKISCGRFKKGVLPTRKLPCTETTVSIDKIEHFSEPYREEDDFNHPLAILYAVKLVKREPLPNMAIDQEASESSNASPNPNSDNADLYLNAGTSNGGNRFPEITNNMGRKIESNDTSSVIGEANPECGHNDRNYDSSTARINELITNIQHFDMIMTRASNEYTMAVHERELVLEQLKSILRARDMEIDRIESRLAGASVTNRIREITVPTTLNQKRPLNGNSNTNLTENPEFGRHGKIKKASEVFNEVQKRNNIKHRTLLPNSTVVNRLSVTSMNIANPNLGSGGSHILNLPKSSNQGSATDTCKSRNPCSSSQNDHSSARFPPLRRRFANDNYQRTQSVVQNINNNCPPIQVVYVPQLSVATSPNTNPTITTSLPSTSAINSATATATATATAAVGNSSLLHDYLLQRKKLNSTPSSSNSPTLEKLLTKPDRKEQQSRYANSKSVTVNNYDVSINAILSGNNFNNSLNRHEVTITPLNQTATKSNTNHIDGDIDLIIDEDDNNNDSVKKEMSETAEHAPICQGCSINVAQFVCAGCANQWYCSRECQVNAWDDHSELCLPA